MQIVEDLEFKARLVDEIAQREFSERTGVHCSDLCYCLNKQVLRRMNPLPPDEHEILLFSLGWATQRWLTGQSKDEDTRTVDGIQVTCDALSGKVIVDKPNIIMGSPRPWELKCTFQSSAKPIEENVAWVHQIMAQCYVLNSTEAWLTRLEVMGNWKSIFGKKEEKGLPENQKPTLHAYHLTFTPQELADNWAWLRARAALFSDLLSETSVLLPKAMALPQGQEWECSYCHPSYRLTCEAVQ